MRLSQLLDGLDHVVVRPGDPEICDVVIDSRAVTPGALFIARTGWYVDGHDWLDDAVRRGAVAVVVSTEGRAPESAQVPVVRVPAEDPFLGLVSARFHGEPTRSLTVYGVTGTNGKTSTVWLLEHLLAALGERPAMLSTVLYRHGRHEEPAPNTTPDGLVIQRFARESVDRGARALVMEVSSHGLQLQRVAGTAFDVVGFTNLSRDHLDFHGTEERYVAAKVALFSSALAPARAAGKRTTACIVGSDVHADTMAAASEADVTLRLPSRQAAGSGAGAGVARTQERGTQDPRVELGGAAAASAAPPASDGQTLLEVVGAPTLAGTPCLLRHRGARRQVLVPMPGLHNVDNAQLALAMVLDRHPDRLDDVVAALEAFPGVPGRMEVALRDGQRTVLVDYAHTPDAVAHALDAVRALGPREVAIVLGCGGDRDAGKRPLMARAAQAGADRVWLTADNPRSERVADILAQMEAGLDPSDATSVVTQPDRALAIAAALASGADCVLIAGKGHEGWQEVGGRRFPFDDGEVARRAALALPGASEPVSEPLSDAGQREGSPGRTPPAEPGPQETALQETALQETALREAFARVPLLAGWSAARLARAVGGRVVQAGAALPLGPLVTDSRKVVSRALFAALSGERFDAHTFLPQVIEAGAGALLVADGRAPAGTPGDVAVIEVDDPEAALGRLARALLEDARRGERPVPVVGITGSSGKTTTTRLVAGLLAELQGVAPLATIGNFNNQIGLPLSVAPLAPCHRGVVLEMGANAPGNIAELVSLARPDVALLTMVGSAHMEGFGGPDGVRRAKQELVRDGRPVVMVAPVEELPLGWADAARAVGARVLSFGNAGASLDVLRPSSTGPVTLRGGGQLLGWEATFALDAPGLHSARNAAGALLAAVLVARFAQTDGTRAALEAAVESLDAGAMPAPAVVAAGMARFEAPAGRLGVRHVAGRVLIDDTYNANPESVRASLDVLGAAGAPRFAVLGDMLELGASERLEHLTAGRYAAGNAEVVVGVGARGQWIAEGAQSAGGRAVAARDAVEAAAWLAAEVPVGGTVLCKGSRGARMERVIEALERAWTEGT